MFPSINMLWAWPRLIWFQAIRKALKWALRKAQNIFTGVSLKIGETGEYWKVTGGLLCEGRSSVRKQAKFCRRILCSRQRILRSPMPNEHPVFMPKNINCAIIITLEGIDKTKTTKNDHKTVCRIIIPFINVVRKQQKNTVVASRFWLADYIVQLFDSYFSQVYFSRIKYILASQTLHFSPHNLPQCSTK